MGLNTTVVILNDALGAIESDPDFGMNLVRAIRAVGKQPLVVDSLYHENAAVVIETHHASFTVCVEVGNNTGKVVSD